MAVELDAFPEARANRAGPAPGVSVAVQNGGTPVPPTPQAFPFNLTTELTSRSTISSPRQYGPALLQTLSTQFTHTGAAQRITLELGIDTSAITETNVALTTTRRWRSLFEFLASAVSTPGAEHRGIFNLADGGGFREHLHPLNFPINEQEFFLVISLVNSSGVTVGCNGLITLLTRVDPQVFANFL